MKRLTTRSRSSCEAKKENPGLRAKALRSRSRRRQMSDPVVMFREAIEDLFANRATHAV